VLCGWLVGWLAAVWFVGWLVGWTVGWLVGWLVSFFTSSACSDSFARPKLIRFSIYREILCKIEVEHDFSGGLSKRVTLKFSWQPPNFMTFFNPQDFRLGGVYAKLAMTESINYNICDFEQF